MDDATINAHLWYTIVIIIVCLITIFSTVVISGIKKGVYSIESVCARFCTPSDSCSSTQHSLLHMSVHPSHTGIIMVEMQHKERAIELFTHLIALDPENKPAMQQLQKLQK